MKRLRSKRKLLENHIFENQFLEAKMESLRNETSTCFHSYPHMSAYIQNHEEYPLSDSQLAHRAIEVHENHTAQLESS